MNPRYLYIPFAVSIAFLTIGLVLAQPGTRGVSFAENTSTAGSSPGATAKVFVYLPVLLQPMPPDSTPTPTPTPGQDPTPIPAPDPGVNLLLNGSFSDGFEHWQAVNWHWHHHKPIDCEPTGAYYAEMDRDEGVASVPQWEVGDEDWLWQDVYTDQLHSKLIFEMIEAHHMVEGIYEVTIYGSYDGMNWEVVYFRDGAESPYGTGKCSLDMPPEHFVYEIESDHPHYRLEIRGKMVDEKDGFLIGGLVLRIE